MISADSSEHSVPKLRLRLNSTQLRAHRSSHSCQGGAPFAQIVKALFARIIRGELLLAAGRAYRASRDCGKPVPLITTSQEVLSKDSITIE